MRRTKPTCRHGIGDNVEVTDKTVTEDYRHRTRTIIYGYWCPEHQSFGHCTMKYTNVEFPPRESTAPRAC